MLLRIRLLPVPGVGVPTKPLQRATNGRPYGHGRNMSQ